MRYDLIELENELKKGEFELLKDKGEFIFKLKNGAKCPTFRFYVTENEQNIDYVELDAFSVTTLCEEIVEYYIGRGQRKFRKYNSECKEI